MQYVKKLSIIIPARDEEDNLTICIAGINKVLTKHLVNSEIIVVDDGSRDETPCVLKELEIQYPKLKSIRNNGENGFGNAIRCGLKISSGDAIAIMMADLSDEPEDLIRYWEKINEGYDCVFGSRFISGSKVIDYPRTKLIINRIVNTLIRYAFSLDCNDITNAFKMYRKHTIDGCQPLISPHFNLTVEIPIKAAIRGYSWAVIPISWRNRSKGLSKLKLREMGSRYFFIVAYLWLEKYFSRGDFMKK